MMAFRSIVWPASRLGKWAAGAASASVAGLWIGTITPDRAGWSAVGMAGAAAGLTLGLAGGLLALAAVWLRGDLTIGVAASSMPFAAAVYLIRRSLVPHQVS
jgi:hypothetical protein